MDRYISPLNWKKRRDRGKKFNPKSVTPCCCRFGLMNKKLGWVFRDREIFFCPCHSILITLVSSTSEQAQPELCDNTCVLHVFYAHICLMFCNFNTVILQKKDSIMLSLIVWWLYKWIDSILHSFAVCQRLWPEVDFISIPLFVYICWAWKLGSKISCKRK